MYKKDIEKILFTAEYLKKRVEELGLCITKDYSNISGELVCAGVLKGAAIFHGDLVRAVELPLIVDYLAASSYGSGTTSSGQVKLIKDLDTDIDGKHLLLVEDIIDSGITMNYLKKYFKEKGATSVKLCALLSKPSRRQVEVEIDYLGMEVPDEFLVGYGLDYDGMYRNLPYIGILRRSVYEKAGSDK